MQANDRRGQGRSKSSKDKRGVAIIAVISILALLLIMLTGLLSSASIELRSSQNFSANSSATSLKDAAVNLVIAQIRKATTDLGSTHTWASQPGMVRRYGISSADLEAAYKLYSSQEMMAGPDFDPIKEAAPENWMDQPAIWTDLNERFVRQDGSFGYPIVDPALTDQVEGFSIEEAPGIPEGSAAMPIRWLYMLKDGTVGHLDDTGTFVGPSGSPSASEENPITGRIAFWTDDETSKVNVNTASEGVYWDHPLGNTRTERGNADSITQYPQKPYGYASSMAVRGEFSRYPGHPAETSLSPVLGSALSLSPYPTAEELEDLYTLTPRVVLTGSKGGNTNSDQATISSLDSDRLYSSTDDFVFRPDRSKNPLGSEPGGVVSRSKFFLTSHSRAPELNQFNRPRVLLWPLYRESENRRTENGIPLGP